MVGKSLCDLAFFSLLDLNSNYYTSVTPLQPPYCFSTIPSTFSPQGLCTSCSFNLECSLLSRYPHGSHYCHLQIFAQVPPCQVGLSWMLQPCFSRTATICLLFLPLLHHLPTYHLELTCIIYLLIMFIVLIPH